MNQVGLRHLMRKYVKAWMLRNHLTKKKIKRELTGMITGKLTLQKLFNIAVDFGKDTTEEELHEAGEAGEDRPTKVAEECTTKSGNGSDAVSKSVEVGVKEPKKE